MSADPAAVEALAETLCELLSEWRQTCRIMDLRWTDHDAARFAAEVLVSSLAARDAAMRAEGASTALRETTQTWQQGAWTVLTPAMKGKSGPALITAAAQAAADWLRERADAALDRTEGDT